MRIYLYSAHWPCWMITVVTEGKSFCTPLTDKEFEKQGIDGPVHDHTASKCRCGRI